MSKIFKLKTKEHKPLQVIKEGEYSNNTKQSVPANQEWQNIIYAYDKSNIKLLPVIDKYITKILKSFFNMFSRKLEKEVKFNYMNKRSRRLSTNRVLISTPNFKHTNDKIIITIYIYNRQLTYYFNKLNKLKVLKKISPRLFKNKISYIRYEISNIRKKMVKIQNIFTNSNKWHINYLLNYEFKLYKLYIKRALHRERLYMHFKQIILFNKHRYYNTFLIPIKNILAKVYKKKIEFNLVNLKYYHLNSDILLQIIVIRLRNRKNRILRVLDTSFKKIKVQSKFLMAYKNRTNILGKDLQNKTIHNLINTCSKNNKNNLDIIIKKHFSKTGQNVKYRSDLQDFVMNSINYKSFSGIRIEASGRLSKRITAERSLHKTKYIGNIRDLNSSYVGLSSTILRGNINSSVQHTKIKSKTRIGSFGLKGWVNSV